MNSELWEELWAGTDSGPLFSRLERFYKSESRAVGLLRDSGAVQVCDAACGYGVYSVALASNGFEVYSFDVSPTAASITRLALEHFGLDGTRVKSADIMSTGYPDSFFDAAVAGSVLDHMTVADAKRALAELRRITRPGGILLLSFDAPDPDDLSLPHRLLPDGSILYTSGTRRGIVLHPYSGEEARGLLEGLEVVFEETEEQGEFMVGVRNGV